MPCKPLEIQAGLFVNSEAHLWNSSSETRGMRTVTRSTMGLTVAGPNGSSFFAAGGNKTVRHRFFGTDNHLAVLTSVAGATSITHFINIIDFTAATLQTPLVLGPIDAPSTTPLPLLHHSAGNGAVCLIGASNGSTLLGLAIINGDTGAVLVPLGPHMATVNTINADATATELRIKEGGTVIEVGPLPRGKLTVTPNPQNFGNVPIGGCPVAFPTRTFTLKNTGTDCLIVSAIANAPPFRVSSTSRPFPVDLPPNQTFTATVVFEPAALGNFPNVPLAVTRTPASGDDKLVCSGAGTTPMPNCAVAASPSSSFGHVLVGSTAGPVTVSITNTGQLPISVSVQASPPGSPFSWPPASAALTCGGSTSLQVSFRPTAEGSFSETLTVDAGPAGMRSLTLSGQGCIPNAVIAPQPTAPIGFGRVRDGYRMVRIMRVRNSGDALLTFNARIDGPDAALFGIIGPSGRITEALASRGFQLAPTTTCGPGPTGPGLEEIGLVVAASGLPRVVNATLHIDGHNDATAPADFAYPLTAEIIPGNMVDVDAVFDVSDSMKDPVPGGGRKIDAAVSAGQLLIELIPADRGNRIGATRFSVDADNFLTMTEITAANHAALVQEVNGTSLALKTLTAVASGVMTGVPQFDVPRTNPPPPDLVRAMVVLTDGNENTAWKNPADGRFYTLLGGQARDPADLTQWVDTEPYTPPAGIKLYAVGLGTAQAVSTQQLAAISQGTGGYFLRVETLSQPVAFQLMKTYTQIFMDIIDISVISDPRYVLPAGDRHEIEFSVLQGDVSAMVVLYDLHGIRLPFMLQTPQGKIIDPTMLPAGFQLRAGRTFATRYLEVIFPQGAPEDYAGLWKAVVWHDGLACRGLPPLPGSGDPGNGLPGFRPRDCGVTDKPIEYGICIGVGSNFRLQPYVTPGRVKIGEKILLTGVVSEAGLPVTGCTVTAEAVAPDGSIYPLKLYDDGAHDDGEADDGEYAVAFTKTHVGGSYQFTFRAEGKSRDGEPVVREAVRSKYVDGPRDDRGPREPNGGFRGDVLDELVRHRKLLEEITRLLRRE